MAVRCRFLPRKEAPKFRRRNITQPLTLSPQPLRKDGYRNVERVRLSDWRAILPVLRRAKLKGRMDGKRLTIQAEDPNQLLLPFSDAG